MNTKIILGLGSSILLASSLLAFPPQSDIQEGAGSTCKDTKMMKHQKHKRGPDVVHLFMKLDLSDAQRVEIMSIIKESMKSIPNPNTAFSDTSFNKEQFIKLEKQKRDYRIEHRAEIIEKIYNTLSSDQKKDFKTILDMDEIMKKTRKHLRK